MMTIRKKDKVVVLAGEHKGKQGEVIEVLPKVGRVLVSKVNFVIRHTRATRTEPGGRREKEASLPISRVMLVCPKCNHQTRTKTDFLSDGTKARVCRHCGEMIV
ncbi:MAG TPA: 50S ribosomal protein L24 [Elusimicrobiota bacterium]|nr:50S ribosomal protein L24 [Elusimicrobiota bacterium]